MKKTIRNYCLSSAAAICLTGNASAAWTFADADIMLGFRANGGVGIGVDLFFNLGSSTVIRDGGLRGLRGNINDDLVANYGSNWSTRTDLTFGAVGNRSQGSGTVSSAFTPGQPDPDRIVYLTRTASSSFAAADHPAVTGNNLASSMGGVTTLEGILGVLTETVNADGAALFIRAGNETQYDQTSWATRVPFSGGSFNGLSNIGTAFSADGSTRLADIQRLGGSRSGIAYTNTTVATLSIDKLGNISLIPEPSSLTLAGIAALALVTRRRR